VAALPSRRPSVELRELASMRFEMLDDLGLGDPRGLAARVPQLTDRDLDALAYGALDLAKACVDRLLEESQAATPPVVLWAEKDSVAEVIGRTLLWADRYLVPDALADAFLGSEPRLTDVERAIREMLDVPPSWTRESSCRFRPSSQLCSARRLRTRPPNSTWDVKDLVSWVDGQLLVEGPTRREALIIGARDDISLGGDHFESFSHIDPDSLDEATRTIRGRLLGEYRPGFDYHPWVAQTRRKVVAALIQEVNQSVAVAETFGGHAVTRASFRARLLQRKDAPLDPASALVWANVPWLPATPPQQLAEIASEDATVEALRPRTRRAFDRARGGDLGAAAAHLSGELEEAARELEEDMHTNRNWALLCPMPFLALSVGLGATTSGRNWPGLPGLGI
jgi:hypothetical protein